MRPQRDHDQTALRPNKVTFSMRMDAPLRAAIDKAAAADRRSVGDFVRIVLEDHLTARDAAA
jgi:hypothetical protein